jgi:hypothetical protein
LFCRPLKNLLPIWVLDCDFALTILPHLGGGVLSCDEKGGVV